MGSDMVEDLKRFRRKGDLCSIRRDEIDENSMQCFVVALSNSLVAIYEVRDFKPIGYCVFRISDLTSVRRKRTDEFQQRLLESDGAVDPVALKITPAISSYRALVEWLDDDEILIIEDEAADEPSFFIGVCEEATENDFVGRFFSGAGNWSTETWSYAWHEITTIQFRTDYIAAYQRYFDRAADRG